MTITYLTPVQSIALTLPEVSSIHVLLWNKSARRKWEGKRTKKHKETGCPSLLYIAPNSLLIDYTTMWWWVG
jgi:hypothetical protein